MNGSTGGATRGTARRAGVEPSSTSSPEPARGLPWPPWARRAGAQPKATITYWNGLTGADGKVMDELIDQFTRDSGIRIEQQRLPWADLYAKLQVAVPAGEGPDVWPSSIPWGPHFERRRFANDGPVWMAGSGPSPAGTATCSLA